ncbi:MAG: ferredoxin [Chloroflexota bacterium]
MKVRVEPGLCDAYGKCAKACPELFHLDEYGYASTSEDTPVPPELYPKARSAAGSCPTEAVIIDEE